MRDESQAPAGGPLSAGGDPPGEPAPLPEARIASRRASRTAHSRDNTLGILAVVAGYTVIVINDVLVKLAGATVPLGEIMGLRGIIAVSCLGLMALLIGPRTISRNLFSWPVALRVAGEVTATVTYLIGIMQMPLGIANAIFQVTPLLIIAGSAAFLNEHVGLRRWIAAILGFIGTLMIIQPGGAAYTPYALLIIACSIAVAVRDLATRQADPGIPSLQLSVLSAAAILVTGFVMGLTETWIWPNAWSAGYIVAAALLLSSGYWLMTFAARTGEISVIAPFRYTGVPVSLLASWLVWSEVPNELAAAGIAVVVASGLYALRRT